jgi:hypothetical protein
MEGFNMKLYEDFNRKDFNNEDLKDEGLEELEELERLEAEGKLKIKEWIIGNRKFNEISNDDIKETLNLFSDNLKIKLKDEMEMERQEQENLAIIMLKLKDEIRKE